MGTELCNDRRLMARPDKEDNTRSLVAKKNCERRCNGMQEVEKGEKKGLEDRERWEGAPFSKTEQKQLISIALLKLRCLDCGHFSSLAGEQRKEMKPVEFLRLIVVQDDLLICGYLPP